VTIRIDFTQHSCVAVCSLCGWRGLAGDRTEAWRQSRSHELRAHPGETQAARALDMHVRSNLL
jgi:hypothetical protein